MIENSFARTGRLVVVINMHVLYLNVPTFLFKLHVSVIFMFNYPAKLLYTLKIYSSEQILAIYEYIEAIMLSDLLHVFVFNRPA